MYFNKNLTLVLFLIIVEISLTLGYQYKYVIQNDCPSQFHFLESTIVKSNCDVPFNGNVTYTIPNDGTGDRSAPVTTSGRCGAEYTLFEGGVSDFNDILFVDISNIDAFTAGLNVTAYYNDGSLKNIHCCSNCPNTTDSPNCYGTGNYWFPTEISGYGTAGWSTKDLNLLHIQWSCLSEEDLNACKDVTCLHDSVCMGGMRAPDGVKGLCLCQPGYQGTSCEFKSDYTPCYGVNCGYYGVCNATTASAGGKKCSCLDGYTGELCDKPPKDSSCYNVNCGPRSICKNGKCECQAGSSGCGCSTLGNCTIINNLDYQGNDLPSGTFTLKSPEECCSKCQTTPLCYAFTFAGDQCYLKSSVPSSGGSVANGKYSGYLPQTTTTDDCVVVGSSIKIVSSSLLLFIVLILSIFL
ncbi:hypothetical protein DICPUDRAFT_33473 [Dictyostelium purpureum]|uniref:EGF-like domain-containing protein n=1 Tax=Dictyostelium purpureum TaxID=5786 RepID=F0ZKZ0_DICPU|nr:uncharacterized protein DICPUDRAFT_33473 [Dictyostelium purpureum]EGC35410.1 hypothetical protein DICPUDRAFT_33473 [Dictyostelium purpureum]|eukprot:XP_003288086.1 hypothetical protein DICPUDRAFT_33473 [Dictyostelium purpureum]